MTFGYMSWQSLLGHEGEFNEHRRNCEKLLVTEAKHRGRGQT